VACATRSCAIYACRGDWRDAERADVGVAIEHNLFTRSAWKHLPLDEHWIVFDIEMLAVEPWTPQLQFEYMDKNNDSNIVLKELLKHTELLSKQFGKNIWHNEDVDNVQVRYYGRKCPHRFQALTYFIRYFDMDGNEKISKEEYTKKMNEDIKEMGRGGKKPKGRKRDSDVGWILDFNNDGVVTFEEIDNAPEILARPPTPPGTQQMKKEEL
jgi:hypothetical protein